jgi:hypothetical protein
MLSRLARSITAVALALTVQATVPGWTTAAIAAASNHKNCAAKSHQHAKIATAKPAKPTQWSGGGAGAQLRRAPDVQVISFGP